MFSLLNNDDSIFIALDDLFIDFLLILFFSDYFFLFFFLKFLHLMDEYLGFSLLLFSGFQTLNLSGLDLVNNDFFAS